MKIKITFLFNVMILNNVAEISVSETHFWIHQIDESKTDVNQKHLNSHFPKSEVVMIDILSW